MTQGMVELAVSEETKSSEAKESFYRRIGVIPPDCRLEASVFVDFPNASRVVDEKNAWVRAGGDSFYAIERVSFVHPDGKSETRYIAQKAIVSGSWGTGGLQQTAEELVKRQELLAEHGVPVPHVYAVEGATIYRDFILRDDMTDVRRFLSHPSDFERASSYVQSLSRIAYVIDSLGFGPLDYLRDLVHDPDTNTFYLIDTGFDLGAPSGRGGGMALEQLNRLVRGNEALLQVANQSYTGEPAV